VQCGIDFHLLTRNAIQDNNILTSAGINSLHLPRDGQFRAFYYLFTGLKFPDQAYRICAGA
jgi:hypothetical protein